MHSRVSEMLGSKLAEFQQMNKHQFFSRVLSFCVVVCSVLLIWRGLVVATGSESPIVVVLSGSMQPTLHRGDLLFLTNPADEPIKVGETVVFKIIGRNVPIVHRVIEVNDTENGSTKFLTKGDNNTVDDRELYAPGQKWLTPRDVVGKVQARIPYLGMITIMLNEYSTLKYAVLACLGLHTLFHKE